MDSKDLDKKLDDMISFLEEALPNVDLDHRNEILDIADLLKARAKLFANEYGLN